MKKTKLIVLLIGFVLLFAVSVFGQQLAVDYSFNQGENTNVTYYVDIGGEKLTVPYAEFINEGSKFGFVFNETLVEQTLALSGKTFDKKIYYQIDSSENYIKNKNNPYVLERLLGSTKQIVNQIGQIEERPLKRFLTFEEIFNKEANIWNNTVKEINEIYCVIGINFLEKTGCINDLTDTRLVNKSFRTRRDIDFSFTGQNKNWIISFFNLFDLDPIFIDDTDSNWDAGTFVNMKTSGTGTAANLTSSSKNVSGSFGSQIFDSNNVDANWKNISVTVEQAYGIEIGRAVGDGNDASDEDGFINTTGLFLLLHFNNESDFDENDSLFRDFSIDANSDRTITNRANGTCRLDLDDCPTRNDSRLGSGALKFDGSDDRVDINYANGFGYNVSNAVTLAAWVRIDSAGGGTIIRNGDFNAVGYGFNAGEAIATQFQISGVIKENTGPDNMPVGEWNHAAVTYDGTDIKQYVNGLLTLTVNAPGTIDVSSTGVSIGSDTANLRPTKGIIDEVAIWNRTLSSDEILKLYKRGVLRLNLSVRSCDDSACSGEAYQQVTNLSFMGGKITNLSTGSGGLSANRFFQYNFTFSSNATNTDLDRVVINNVTIEFDNVTVAEVANEADGVTAIGTGIQNALLSGYTNYTDQLIYARDLDNTQDFGIFDRFVKKENKAWAFNYVTDGEEHVGLFNLTPVLYVLELSNQSTADITSTVEIMINATK